MKKLALTCFGVALIGSLSGCNLVQSLKPDTSQAVFTAPSYHGKELPSAFLANQHHADESNGHDFRGYHFGKRHWKF